MLPKAVSDYLLANRQRHVSELVEFLRIPSMSMNNPQGCRRAAQWLEKKLHSMGFAAEVLETAGQPAVLAEYKVSENLPTVLVYGHYDVQPPDPLDLWTSPPFEPEIRDECIFARGASDDKGQVFAHLMAMEAWIHAGGGLPVNVRLLIEGEEEVGSPNLEPFIVANASRLKADACVISDSDFFAEGLPSITVSLRGLAYVEITLQGPSRDLHSGLHGGAVTNPIDALAKIVAAMHDETGRVTIPGFYDDVISLSPRQRDDWAKLPFGEKQYAESLGVAALGGGEKGYSVLERRWIRPTLDCNGIFGGYSGPGAKTVIASQAGAKVSMRLVANQDPQKIIAGVRKFVQDRTPPGIVSEVRQHSSGRPVYLRSDSPAMSAARTAMAEAFGREPMLIACGASVPVTETIQRLLGLDAVMMGFGLPEDNLHSPNERMRLGQIYGGSVASAVFLRKAATLS